MNGRRSMLAPLLVLLAACAGAAPAVEPNGIAAGSTPAAAPPELSLEQARAFLQDPTAGVVFIDANTRDLYDSWHVPGARWVKYDAVTEADLPADRGTPLVFYCANRKCSASDTAAATAIELGWTDVRLMPGGIFGWRGAGYPTEPAPAASEDVSQDEAGVTTPSAPNHARKDG